MKLMENDGLWTAARIAWEDTGFRVALPIVRRLLAGELEQAAQMVDERVEEYNASDEHYQREAMSNLASEISNQMEASDE